MLQRCENVIQNRFTHRSCHNRQIARTALPQQPEMQMLVVCLGPGFHQSQYPSVERLNKPFEVFASRFA